MIRKSNYTKHELITAIGHAVQAFQDATDAMDEAAGKALGLNRTDLRCLSIVVRGSCSAGALAEMAGLTRGAMTTVLDRLEERGYVRRVWEQADRRSLNVEMTDTARRKVEDLYGPLARAGARLLEKYSVAELDAIRRYLEAGRELQRSHAGRVRGTLSR